MEWKFGDMLHELMEVDSLRSVESTYLSAQFQINYGSEELYAKPLSCLSVKFS